MHVNSFVYKQNEKELALIEIKRYRNSLFFMELNLSEKRTARKIALIAVCLLVSCESKLTIEESYQPLRGVVHTVLFCSLLKFFTQIFVNRIRCEIRGPILKSRLQYQNGRFVRNFRTLTKTITIFKPQFASETELGKILPLEVWQKIQDYIKELTKQNKCEKEKYKIMAFAIKED